MSLGRRKPQTQTPAIFSGPLTKSTSKSSPPACTAPPPPPRTSISFPPAAARARSLACSYELSIGFYSRSKPSITVCRHVHRSPPRSLRTCDVTRFSGSREQRAGDDGHRLDDGQERQRAAGGCPQTLGGEACVFVVAVVAVEGQGSVVSIGQQRAFACTPTCHVTELNRVSLPVSRTRTSSPCPTTRACILQHPSHRLIYILQHPAHRHPHSPPHPNLQPPPPHDPLLAAL